MARMIATCLVFALIVGLGCSSNKTGGSSGFAKTEFTAAATTGVTLDGAPVNTVGVTFTPPKVWNNLGASAMRLATFSFAPVEGEKDSAVLAISFFGKNSGGAIKDNILRWIHQVQIPGNGNPEESAVQSDITVDGMPAHVVELAGTFLSGGMMGSPSVPKENYRLTGVILETSEGNLFFKLTGPAKTAQKMAQDFAAMLLALKKAPASTM